MSEGRRTPREDDGREERKYEPETVPVDVESQERQLEEAGWVPVERLGKRVWRHPQSGHLYPHGPAVKRLRMQEVRRLRQARGWNQTELAFHAGLAPSVISQIENGKRNPSARTLDKLATALNVEVGDLFPKAQAPLPLEEDQDKRAAPFVDAWASYVLRRAEEWKEALPEEGEQLFAKPQLAFEALSRNEQVQTEATMLLETVSGAIVDTVLSGTEVFVDVYETREGKLPPGTERRLGVHLLVRLEERADLMELREALNHIDSVADEWCVRTVNQEDFLKAAGKAVEEISGVLEQAKERAERAIEERRNVAQMFERST